MYAFSTYFLSKLPDVSVSGWTSNDSMITMCTDFLCFFSSRSDYFNRESNYSGEISLQLYMISIVQYKN